MSAFVPFAVQLLFLVTVGASLLFFYRAFKPGSLTFSLCILLSIVQSVLGWTGFYLQTETRPPHFPLLILPSVGLILLAFLLPAGRRWLNNADVYWMTFLSVVRIPVEICLYFLYKYDQIPVSMTFEGRNYDLFSGISALVLAFVYMKRKSIPSKALLAWNGICLVLVLNVVITGVLSAPGPLQQLSFDHPNRGVLYFPFTLLPALIVPLVILSHLNSIRLILKKGNQ